MAHRKEDAGRDEQDDWATDDLRARGIPLVGGAAVREPSGNQPGGESNLDRSTTTSVALMTPLGRGAIATIAVAGTDAEAHVAAHFTPAGRGSKRRDWPIGRPLVGLWQHASGAAEDVVVDRTSADWWEIHCHGGPLAARDIVDQLVAGGCRAIDGAELVAHQFPRSTRGAALIELSRAPTTATAAILADQARGTLDAALKRVAELIAARDEPHALAQLAELLSWAPLGLHLTAPWNVAVVGPPNAGKSTLVNRLLGFERAIVSDLAGTTRDVLATRTAFEGWPVELADTAGLGETTDPLRTEAAARARATAARADLLLLVIDGTAPVPAALIAEWPDALVVVNKLDAMDSAMRERLAGLSAPLVVSALRGDGVRELTEAIARRLVARSPSAGQAVPFRPAHVAGVAAARARLVSGEPDAALAELEAIRTQDP
jgi:tRNA modification GTPase